MAEQAEITDLLGRLASAPARYEAALSRLEDADSVTSLAPDEWTPAQVLAHVRASHDILEHRIYAILARDDPYLNAYDDMRWAQVARYDSLPIIDSLQIMRLRRHELTRALAALRPADWDRTGVHEVSGSITLLQIARHVADHDDEHIAQIQRAGR